MCACDVCEAVDKCKNGKVPPEEEVLAACRYENEWEYVMAIEKVE